VLAKQFNVFLKLQPSGQTDNIVQDSSKMEAEVCLCKWWPD